MIKFEEPIHNQKHDIVSFCTNCQAISASNLTACPKCNHRPLLKKSILGYINDVRQPGYPVMTITRQDLINNFIPVDQVNQLTDEEMVIITRNIEKFIFGKYPDIIKKSYEKVKNIDKK